MPPFTTMTPPSAFREYSFVHQSSGRKDEQLHHMPQ